MFQIVWSCFKCKGVNGKWVEWSATSNGDSLVGYCDSCDARQRIKIEIKTMAAEGSE